MNADESWNAMVDAISAMEYPTGDTANDEAFLLFQFYSSLESGGHESFLNLFEEDIQMNGPAAFFGQLANSLNMIGGSVYAAIENKYGLLLWEAYKELENGGQEDAAFYALVEKVDNESAAADPALEGMLQAYFEKLYKI